MSFLRLDWGLSDSFRELHSLSDASQMRAGRDCGGGASLSSRCIRCVSHSRHPWSATHCGTVENMACVGVGKGGLGFRLRLVDARNWRRWHSCLPDGLRLPQPCATCVSPMDSFAFRLRLVDARNWRRRHSSRMFIWLHTSPPSIERYGTLVDEKKAYSVFFLLTLFL
jgi:hypothetical protein